jgi:hypothetical protein
MMPSKYLEDADVHYFGTHPLKSVPSCAEVPENADARCIELGTHISPCRARAEATLPFESMTYRRGLGIARHTFGTVRRWLLAGNDFGTLPTPPFKGGGVCRRPCSATSAMPTLILDPSRHPLVGPSWLTLEAIMTQHTTPDSGPGHEPATCPHCGKPALTLEQAVRILKRADPSVMAQLEVLAQLIDQHTTGEGARQVQYHEPVIEAIVPLDDSAYVQIYVHPEDYGLLRHMIRLWRWAKSLTQEAAGE